MRGLQQNKRCNAANNERRAVWAAFRAAAAKTYELKHVYREDLLTGEVTESSRSKMNSEVSFFACFERLKTRLALPLALVWEEMEQGATFYTEHAKFWIENARPAPTAPVKPEPKMRKCQSGACNSYDNPAEKGDLCIDCYEQAKSERFFQSEEIERIYFDVV